MPPIRIERTTRGLGITPSTTSDNLTPQETTNQDSPDMGQDRASLSCPGSSVVAESRQDDSELAPLIKSPAPTQPENTQDTQDEELPSVSEDET